MDGVLIVEDEFDIADAVRLALEREGVEPVYIADSLAAGRDVLLRAEIAVAIIDIGLPDGSGLDLAVEMRSSGSNAAIFFLTARDSEADRLAGFGVGADDYISKPFSPIELSARVRAFFRRSRTAAQDDKTIVVGRVRIGAQSGTIEVDGEPVALPALEFKLLRFLAEHRGMAFTPADLYEKVWAAAALGQADENNVRVHVRRLRERIEADPSHPELLMTVRGLGYRFDEPPRGGEFSVGSAWEQHEDADARRESRDHEDEKVEDGTWRHED
ncbi:MAG: response regulator transcription factor [Coriobacteriia bacterium]|nr:response regulator transcription factor [Coriobacteriia bacterium]